MSVLATPAFGDAMEKTPRVFYTPPPSPKPSAPAAKPQGGQSGGAGGQTGLPSQLQGGVVPPPPTVPGASPAASSKAGAPPSASPKPGARPASPLPSGAPQPGASAVPSPGASTPLPSPSGTPYPESYPTPLAGPSESPELEPTPNPNVTPAPKVKVKGDFFVSDRQKGLVTFRGNVRVDYGTTTLTAEELSVDQKAQVIFTDTRFTLVQPDPKRPGEKQVITGTGLRYNYETREAIVNDASLSTPAEASGQTVYIRARKIQSYGESRVDATDATFSTCDFVLEERVPHYHVESKSLQYFAGDKIVAWDSKIYLNNRFVLWLPVMVIPLKGEQNSLNIGRSEVEGFWLRSGYNYSLPALNNGYFLNDGRLIANAFEKKGLGLGFEHNTRWGYQAATYAFLYGLTTLDRGNLVPFGATLSSADESSYVNRGKALFDLYGGPFSDHQWGIEHKQRLLGNMELTGRFEDHDIYDPFAQNYRNNRQTSHVDLKDNLPGLGNLNYDVSYDGTNQRGNQVPTGGLGSSPTSLSQSLSDRWRANAGAKVGETDLRLTTQFDRSGTRTREVYAQNADRQVLQAAEGVPLEFAVRQVDGAANVNVNNQLSANTSYGPNTRSEVTLPYRINYRENVPSPPPIPGATGTPAPTLPVASPSPMDQQAEPKIVVTHRLPEAGTLTLTALKFLDLTQPLPGVSPAPIAQQVQRVKSLNKFDQLPELVFNSDPLLSSIQPITLKLGYGRYFEYASFKPAAGASSVDVNFPGNTINRLNMESSLASKAFDIGLKSQLDFGGTGYRQFFYSTNDAQYAIDERVRLSTKWTDKITSNLNYTNNLTPDAKELAAQGRIKFTNNSPFQQDKIALSKQTRLTADMQVTDSPFFTYALRGGYDYINLLYDNLSSEVTWRSRLFGLNLPFSLTLNGQYDFADKPGLVIEQKPLDIAYMPKVPLIGFGGKWLPVSGTFTLRSTPDTFGGAFGSNSILPGWQLDNSLAYDFDTGLWQSLVNRLYITFGTTWQDHMDLVLGGYYDTTLKTYRFSEVGLSKDLHDFILSAQYNSLASTYSLTLTMVAFPGQPVSFGSNTFNRRTNL